MDWRTLYNLYSGLVGKCLLYVALTTPIAFYIRTFGSTSPKMFTTSLIGALLILIGYLLCLIKSPDIIKRHNSPISYTSSLIPIYEHIDLDSEFNLVDQSINASESEFKQALSDSYLTSLNFASVQSLKEVVGEKKAVRVLSTIRYALENKANPNIRIALSISFALGSVIVFIPTIYNVYTILSGL